MSDAELATAVRTIVMEHANPPRPRIDEDHSLVRDLGFDSLAFLLTLSDLEDRIGFRYPLERMDELRQIRFADLIGMVLAERTRVPIQPAVGMIRPV